MDTILENGSEVSENWASLRIEPKEVGGTVIPTTTAVRH